MKKTFTLAATILLAVTLTACDEPSGTATPVSSSGASKATAQVHKDANGLTTEQQNIVARLDEDTKPGSIKHLYVISAYSGQVILYSTVRGKVTSGSKRLTPQTVDGRIINGTWYSIPITIGNSTYYTNEVLGDDGAYGGSGDYVYWWDTKGVYHQHYVSGGQILHVASQPIAAKGIIINMEESTENK